MNERQKYFVKQKLLGIGLLLLAALSLSTGDGTLALFLIPLGLYTVFTKKMVLMNEYFFKHENDEPNEEP